MARVAITTNFNDDVVSALPGTTTIGGTSATATITFTSNVVVDETVKIQDGNGLIRTYTAKGSNSATDLEFINTDGSHASATGLKAAIEHSNGHPLIKVDRTDSVLTLTQHIPGPDGNSAIVSTLSAGDLGTTTVTEFTGGRSGSVDLPAAALPAVAGNVGLSDTTDDDFATKGYGNHGGSEARHRRLRNLGII